jgi:predicted transcriptional regulator YdeE/DNA-binding transcriptional MerR regulator
MLKIGEFSKIAQVSIKTLRYYDQMGLLKPAHIDRYTGYRYYTLSQLPRLNRILALKDLDFSLDQIQELLKVQLSSEVLHNMLRSKAGELKRRILDERARLLRVESRLTQLDEVFELDPPPIVLKSAPNYLVATVRKIFSSLQGLSQWQQTTLHEIHRYLHHQSFAFAGPDLLIYHHDEFREEDLDVEVGTIIHESRNKVEQVTSEGEINLYTLRGVNQLATALHMQTAGNLPNTYAVLTWWTQVNGFRPIGHWRELMYEQDSPTKERVIEVQRPVMKAIDFYSHLEIKDMEPKIITKPGFTLVGLRYYGKNEHGEIAQLWDQFNQRIAALGGMPNETGEAAIGLCIGSDEEPLEGAFEYVAGFPVSKVDQVPEGFVVREIPELSYAVFAHKGDLPSLSKTYEYIYESWLPQSGYQLAAKIDFEYYDQDFKDFAPDSVFYIYVPIKKA